MPRASATTERRIRRRPQPAPVGLPWLACLLMGLVVIGSAVARSEEAGATTPEGRLAAADAVWATRAERLEGRLALPETTERALSAYLEAIDAEAGRAGSLEARWKALRAAHYLSEFTTAPEARRDRAVEEATRLASESLDWLVEGGEPLAGQGPRALDRWLAEAGLPATDVAQLQFWSAIVWGAYGQRVGLLTIVRKGIARRMYDGASLAIRLEPSIERGGAYRLLSRLHADLPRVPFVSGWVDRSESRPMAERARAIAPEDPGNRLIMALALRDEGPESGERVRALLELVAAAEPRRSLRAEDLAIAEQAQELLDEEPARAP